MMRLVLITVASCLTSCVPTFLKTSAQPAVLVIMIENLGFNSFSCGEAAADPQDVMFEGFCNDSVRFTHAYAPSPMSQPTIASLLTGLYPHDHGVRHNGPVGLPSSVTSVAEVAKSQGFRTSFFSGGPPIFRRSGFNQGFDLFDDNVPVNLRRIYRPASDIVDSFLSWQQSVFKNDSKFFSFLFFSDPQFLDSPTSNELGEVRENSHHSQVVEVSESLSKLVREMKKRKIWDTTQIYLIGLNGFVASTRASEPSAVNLFFESTRATLMVKPARKPREGPFTWKIDSNVSLVDVGATLFDSLGQPTPADPSGTKALASVSLSSAMTSPSPDWNPNRKILIESAWASWKKIGGVRAALRRGPYLYLFDENDQVYNTLTDNLEVSPLLLADPGVSRLRDEFAATLRQEDFVPWRVQNSLAISKNILAQDLWRERQSPTDISRLKSLSRRAPDDRELLGWRANLALLSGDWSDLKAAAKEDRPAWKYVAEANLKSANAKEKVEELTDGCLRSLFLLDGEPGKNCGDSLSRDLAVWVNEKKETSTRNRAMDSFLKANANKVLIDRIARADMIAGDVWDVSAGRWPEPAYSDLMLALPEMKKYRSTVRAYIGSESR